MRKIQKIMEGVEELDSPLQALERFFSSGKFPADETAVGMKTPQCLVDVAAIDS